MRRGERCRPWTAAEERRLRELAGSAPLREIALELRRSNEAVRQRASRMGLSLRYWEPRCRATCPGCGMPRTGLMRSGVCRPCELRRLIAGVEAETAATMAELPIAERERYLATETRLGSALPPRPEQPRTEGMGRYRAAKARDRYAMHLAVWEEESLTRVLKARRRRLERMREKLANE